MTDAGGIARCKVSGGRPGGHTVTMTFAGDAYYEHATAQQEIVRNSARR